MTSPTFVLVGHCGPDQFMLRSAVQRFVPDAQVQIVNDDASLASHLGDGAVLLVNRVLDGRFNARGGIELIGAVAAASALLISDLDEAQAEAVEAGALPGFGKSDLYEDETGEKLLAALS